MAAFQGPEMSAPSYIIKSRQGFSFVFKERNRNLSTSFFNFSWDSHVAFLLVQMQSILFVLEFLPLGIRLSCTHMPLRLFSGLAGHLLAAGTIRALRTGSGQTRPACTSVS